MKAFLLPTRVTLPPAQGDCPVLPPPLSPELDYEFIVDGDDDERASRVAAAAVTGFISSALSVLHPSVWSLPYVNVCPAPIDGKLG